MAETLLQNDPQIVPQTEIEERISQPEAVAPAKSASPGVKRDGVGKTLGVALAVCFICSLVVSSAAVALRPLQEANKTLDMRRNILLAAGLLTEGEQANVDELFKKIEPKVVDLASGQFITEVTPEEFDARKAAKDPQQSITLTAGDDIAGIKRRANYCIVYLLKDGDRLKRVVLPVHGKGLWSTMYGLLALDADLKTVRSFGFYEQAETPGLGGEVDNPSWKAQWNGKRAFDDDGTPDIRVIKGTVNPESPEAAHEVDGLAGATITGRGVEHLLRFWLGEEGYGPLLENLREGS